VSFWLGADMPISLLIILPFVTMFLGFSLVLLLIRGKRKTVLIGVHVLFGLATLEMVVIMLKGWPIGDAVPAGEFGDIAAGILALAAFFGLLRPVFGRGSAFKSNAMLVAHGSAGLAGVLLCIAWLSKSLG
jgi:hypothetical protein